MNSGDCFYKIRSSKVNRKNFSQFPKSDDALTLNYDDKEYSLKIGKNDGTH